MIALRLPNSKHHRMPADTDAHDFGGNVIGSADCCCVVVLVAALSCYEIKTIPHAASF